MTGGGAAVRGARDGPLRRGRASWTRLDARCENSTLAGLKANHGEGIGLNTGEAGSGHFTHHALVLFPREMVLLVHGFPSAVAALRVRKETGWQEDGLGRGTLPGRL